MNNLDYNYFCRSCPFDKEYREANCFTRYKIRRYKAGDYITYKGHVAGELSIVVKGAVTTELVLDSGLGYTVRKHIAPYPIGALALFSEDNCYRADIVASQDCDIISVNRKDIEDQLAECRHFMRSYIAYITKKIDMFSGHLNVLTHKNLKAKLAFYIFTMSKDGHFEFDKKLEALATYLCVERPSLSRAISQLVEEGVITYSRGKGRIINAIALKNMLD